MMLARIVFVLPLACLLEAESASDKSWKNLGHTIKDSSYTAVMRSGRCVTGHVESFDDNTVTISSSPLDRKDIVRVVDGRSVTDHDPIYSGRSSWSDLEQSRPNKYEHIELEMKNHTTRNCRKFSGTGDEASCDGSPVTKSEVSRGFYVRLAPATEWEHYAVQESVPLFAPRTWFNYAFFPRIKVLLYEEGVPEENVKVACNVP